MNAASRALQHSSIFSGEVKWLSISRTSIMMLGLMIFMLISAVSVIYVKNYERSLFSNLESLQQQMDHHQLERGQLLLEQSTWAAPERIQQVAQVQFAMQLPDPGNTLMVAE